MGTSTLAISGSTSSSRRPRRYSRGRPLMAANAALMRTKRRSVSTRPSPTGPPPARHQQVAGPAEPVCALEGAQFGLDLLPRLVLGGAVEVLEQRVQGG